MNSLTVLQLKKLAKQKGIKGYSTLRKSQLLFALKKSKKSRSRSGKRRSVKKADYNAEDVLSDAEIEKFYQWLVAQQSEKAILKSSL